MGLVARVNYGVTPQDTQTRKGLLAKCAFVGPLSRVGRFVIFQSTLECKCLAADGAFVWPLSAVSFHVTVSSVRVKKGFCASVTLIVSLFGMSGQV